MKFSALVLSLALSTSAAFAPSAIRGNTIRRFSTPVEAASAVEENAEAEEMPAAVVMETPAAESVPVDLPVAAAAAVVEEEVEVEMEVPVAAAAEEIVDKILP
jgi:hypothetical protein